MKKKDIIAVVFSGIIIIASVTYGIKMISPKKEVKQEASQAEKISNEFTGDFDKYKDTIDAIEKYTDYGKPSLDNIGKKDLFAPIQ